MKLIDEWRSAHTFLSVQVGAAATFFGLLPADQQKSILEWIGLSPERIPAALGMLFIVARLLSQGKKE